MMQGCDRCVGDGLEITGLQWEEGGESLGFLSHPHVCIVAYFTCSFAAHMFTSLMFWNLSFVPLELQYRFGILFM